MKKICIDARFYGIKHTGIGRYAQNLIENLPENPETEVVLVVGLDCVEEAEKTGLKVYGAKYHPYSSMAQIEMPLLLNKIDANLVHFTHFFVPLFYFGKYIVTIHDLIKHQSLSLSATTRNPLVYLIKYWGYLLTVWLAVKRSRKIIVPARYWQEEISQKYQISKDKIIVTYEGVSHDFT